MCGLLGKKLEGIWAGDFVRRKKVRSEADNVTNWRTLVVKRRRREESWLYVASLVGGGSGSDSSRHSFPFSSFWVGWWCHNLPHRRPSPHFPRVHRRKVDFGRVNGLGVHIYKIKSASLRSDNIRPTAFYILATRRRHYHSKKKIANSQCLNLCMHFCAYLWKVD